MKNYGLRKRKRKELLGGVYRLELLDDAQRVYRLARTDLQEEGKEKEFLEACDKFKKTFLEQYDEESLDEEKRS